MASLFRASLTEQHSTSEMLQKVKPTYDTQVTHAFVRNFDILDFLIYGCIIHNHKLKSQVNCIINTASMRIEYFFGLFCRSHFLEN